MCHHYGLQRHTRPNCHKLRALNNARDQRSRGPRDDKGNWTIGQPQSQNEDSGVMDVMKMIEAFTTCEWRGVLIHDYLLCPCINTSNAQDHKFMHHIIHCFLFIACLIYKFFLFFFYFDLTFLVLFLNVFKIQKSIKIEKSSKSLITCLCVYHMWVWPSTFILMAQCIYELSLFCMHINLCGRNLEIYVCCCK